MRKQERPSRLNFEFPADAHMNLKIQAVRLGTSVKDLATQAIIEKLEALEMQEDIEAYDIAMEKYKSGKLITISHEEMMKRVGWNDL